jgi:hypothetical protein
VRYVLTLLPLDGDGRTPPPERRLARALKDLLRQHRFRCLSVEQQQHVAAAPQEAGRA